VKVNLHVNSSESVLVNVTEPNVFLANKSPPGATVALFHIAASCMSLDSQSAPSNVEITVTLICEEPVFRTDSEFHTSSNTPTQAALAIPPAQYLEQIREVVQQVELQEQLV